MIWFILEAIFIVDHEFGKENVLRVSTEAVESAVSHPILFI